MDHFKETIEKLALTNDEISRFSEAFKKEEFKKMFFEYAEEIRNPENRKRYEEELAAMESERGMDVEFMNPLPGHTLKTVQNGNKKIFINICQCDKLEKPKSVTVKKGKLSGLNWSIPHSFSQPREDIDKKRESCLVYDVVFHPEAYEMGSKNPRFRKIIHDTAMEGIEKMFKVTLDRVNFKILKMKAKGSLVSTVIRRKRSDFNEKQAEINSRVDDPIKFPYPTEAKETEKVMYDVTEEPENQQLEAKKTEFTKPVFSIKYSEDFDITYYVGEQVQKSARPKKMIIEIKMPLISSANCVDLDIERSHLKLTTQKPAKYLLELNLSYPVLPEAGMAKFDKSTKVLKIELLIEQLPELVVSNKSDDLKEFETKLVEEIDWDYDSHRKDDPTSDIEQSLVSIEQMSENSSNLTGELPVQDKQSLSVSLPDKKIPLVTLDFRKASHMLHILCPLRNIESNSTIVECNYWEDGLNHVDVLFSSCGQGGWKVFYHLPLRIKYSGIAKLDPGDVHCHSSMENLLISFPTRYDDIMMESVEFNDQIYRNVDDDPYQLDTPDTNNFPEDVECEDAFNFVYGFVDHNETLKILCTSKNDIVMENEFPQDFGLVSNNGEFLNYDETSHSELVLDDDNSCCDRPLEIQNEGDCPCSSIDSVNIPEEANKKIINQVKSDAYIQPNDIQNINPKQAAIGGTISSDMFDGRNDFAHQTKCAVALNADILFDLE